jgi:uncharacterized RDD family membrane protein YckC
MPLKVIPLQLHDRLLVLLAAVCIAGAALYGALTLLRDLAGLLTTAALLILLAAAAYLLLRSAFTVGKRALRTRSGGASGTPAEPAKVRVKKVEAVVMDRRE